MWLFPSYPASLALCLLLLLCSVAAAGGADPWGELRGASKDPGGGLFSTQKPQMGPRVANLNLKTSVPVGTPSKLEGPRLDLWGNRQGAVKARWTPDTDVIIRDVEQQGGAGKGPAEGIWFRGGSFLEASLHQSSQSRGRLSRRALGEQDGSNSNTLGRVDEMEREVDRNTAQCNETEEEQLRAFFHNIVLIMHCDNVEHEEETTRFWRAVYQRLFDHVVFLSSSPRPELDIEAQAERPFRWDWHYSYFALPKIMARYPDAEGFLWANDDVIVNYWNLLGADKSKIWIPNNFSHPETRYFPFDNETASNWPDDWPSAVEQRTRTSAAFSFLDWRKQQFYNASIAPLTGVFQKRVCDVFYIPRRHVDSFSFDLLPFFREARVASQIAIPTMFYFLDHPGNFDNVLDDMVYRWGTPGSQGLDFSGKQYWMPGVSALRPWRVTDPLGQRAALEVLSLRDPCILRAFPGVTFGTSS